MTLCGEALAQIAGRLRAAGIASARLDARLLLAHVLGVDSMRVFSHPERQLTAVEEERLASVTARRERREPMSHITGRREFWSLPFKVTPDTLDPRPDTETVVEAVLDWAGDDRTGRLSLVDFGTGTGCILLALLSELPQAIGLGVDVSQAALSVAEENARAFGLDHRTRFVLGDWGRGIDGLFDVIVANPPYIPEKDIGSLEPEVAAFEPIGALAGGADGLDCYRSLASDIRRLLKPCGIAVLEVGRGQARAVGLIMQRAGLALMGTRRDLAGIERCLVLSLPTETGR